MLLHIETEQEDDGRWIAEVVELGAMSYGKDVQEAVCNVQALALHVLAEQLEHGEVDWVVT